MNYKVQKAFVIGFFSLAGAIFLAGILWLPITLLVNKIRWKCDMATIDERLNIEYFQETIARSDEIIVHCKNTEYENESVSDDFLTYYASAHDSCLASEQRGLYGEDFSVTIIDGRFTFTADYSSDIDYFHLEYFVHSNPQNDTFWDFWASDIEYFSFNPAFVEVFISYFSD